MTRSEKTFRNSKPKPGRLCNSFWAKIDLAILKEHILSGKAEDTGAISAKIILTKDFGAFHLQPEHFIMS